MRRYARALGITGLVCLAALAAGCAKKKVVLDLYGSIVYEKPEIVGVTHTVRDGRAEGGVAVVEVSIQGDPGLAASFDIYPGIADRQPMQERAAGSYVGEYSFDIEHLGGTFTITGRLEHPDAGEVVRRDEAPLIITRMRP